VVSESEAIDDERAVVLRAVAGDVDAFRELYVRNVDAVFGFLYHRVAPRDVEDLTADTFCRAYERMSSYEWRGVPFRAWLLRIAANAVIGSARKKSSSEVVTAELPPIVVGGADQEALRHVEATELLAALHELAPGPRTVLELRFLEDLSVAETAEVLDTTEEAVRALTYRALRSLRATFAAPRRGKGD
jgi:RNA polymerase sigma-70 factor (ECF subfamily)